MYELAYDENLTNWEGGFFNLSYEAPSSNPAGNICEWRYVVINSCNMKHDVSQAVRRYQFLPHEIGKLLNPQIKFQDPEVVLMCIQINYMVENQNWEWKTCSDVEKGSQQCKCTQTQFQKQGLIIYISSIIEEIEIYRTIIVSVVWYGCENLSLTLREERRLTVFENRAVRKIFGPKRDKVKRSEDQTMRSFMIYIIYQHYSGKQIKKNEMGVSCSTYGVEERCIQSFGGETWGKDQLGRPRHRREDNIKMVFKTWDGEAWTGSIWLRIGADGGLLWTP